MIMCAIEIDGILGRQPRRLRQPRHDAERRPSRSAASIAARPSSNRFDVAAKLVDDEAMDARPLGRLEHAMGAGEAGDDAAAIDVAEQHDRHVGRRRKSHIGDVAGAQIDLRRAAGAFDQDDIGIAREVRKTLQHRRQQRRPSVPDSSARAACPSACPAR